jgi:hypothetical protein
MHEPDQVHTHDHDGSLGGPRMSAQNNLDLIVDLNTRERVAGWLQLSLHDQGLRCTGNASCSIELRAGFWCRLCPE